MVYVTEPETLLGLINVWTGILPVPLTVKPVMPIVAAAVQLYVVPATPDVRIATVVEVALQMLCGVGNITCGVGSIVIS